MWGDSVTGASSLAFSLTFPYGVCFGMVTNNEHSRSKPSVRLHTNKEPKPPRCQ